MSDWDFDAFDEGDDATAPLAHLTRILRLLQTVADEFAPGLQARRSEQARGSIDVALRRFLGYQTSQIVELHDQVCDYVETLNRVLDEQEARKDAAPGVEQPDGLHQTFEPTKVFAGGKTIHLGVVDRYFVFPTSPSLSERLLRLVHKMPDADDLIVREKHDVFGWHYHYCDHKKRRSDVLMSFDRNRAEKKPSPSIKQIVPLCWEPHAINKAKFQAKPWLWGDRKRMSIYAACEPDLTISPALIYKSPSKEAEDVWPI